MKKFIAIEGLRAWLAWGVVFTHIAWWSGCQIRWLRDLGHPAVMTFCIISGFVIAHLIVENNEPYRVYIVRRFFRLFPLFAVMCVLGYWAYKLQTQLPDPEFEATIHRIVADTDGWFWSHVAAHASLLYGAIPGSLLPSTDMAFNMPAWSISVEWQFYLIAPCIVMAVRRQPSYAPVLAAVFAVGHSLQHRGYFGSFEQPAFLLATSGYFAIGIACRLLYPVLKGRIKTQYIPLTCIIMLTSVTHQHALAIWGVVYMGLLAPPMRVYQYAFMSPIAIYLGSRSYSTYLGHFVVVIVAQHIGTRLFGAAPNFPTFALLVVPMTLLFSELLYRSIELPGIRLGAKLCKKLQPAKATMLLKAA